MTTPDLSLRQHPLIKSREFLYAQSVLDADIHPGAGGSAGYSSDWQNVLLTGATGFIGAFLLAELLTSTRARVYCLVRAATQQEGLQRIREKLQAYQIWEDDFATRIEAVPGSLEEKRLGLSEQQFSELAEKVENIFHFGAQVGWISDYYTLARGNVAGLKEVLRLAVTGRVKPVNFSASMVVVSTFYLPFGGFVEEEFLIDAPETLYGGYTQTKWVGEKLLEQARERGLPVNILRLGNIKGHSQSGLGNSGDFSSTFLISCMNKGAAPDVYCPANYLPVDYVCRAAVEIAKKQQDTGKNFQFNNPQITPWAKVVEQMNVFGCKVDLIPKEEWAKFFRARPLENCMAYLKPLFKPLNIDETTQGKTSFDFILQLDSMRYGSRNTEAVLHPTNIRCSRTIDDGLLQRYFDAFSKQGLLTGK